MWRVSGRSLFLPLPTRREDGGGVLPDFDYATNIRATGEFYHTSTAIREKGEIMD